MYWVEKRKESARLADAEGTGTRPDYLVNHADQKFEGPLGISQ